MADMETGYANQVRMKIGVIIYDGYRVLNGFSVGFYGLFVGLRRVCRGWLGARGLRVGA